MGYARLLTTQEPAEDYLEVPYILSEREVQVVQLASEGYTDEAICSALDIAAGTLGTYWVRIRNKTGLVTRTQIACAWMQRVQDLEIMVFYEKLVQLACRESLFFRVPDLTGTIVLRLESSGRIERANSSASEMLQSESVVGMNFRTALGSASEVLQRAINMSQPEGAPVIVHTRSGLLHLRWLLRRDPYLNVTLVGRAQE